MSEECPHGKPRTAWCLPCVEAIVETEIVEMRAELNEQAKLNGMGSEREAKLRAALEWYADEHHWQAIHAKEQLPLAVVDGGEIARKALGHE